MTEGLANISLHHVEPDPVAEATSALHGLHIQNPYTCDEPQNKQRKMDSKTSCTCTSVDRKDGATNIGMLCEYCIHVKGSDVPGVCEVLQVREDSGTEDSSLSSDTPSDSSDTSDSSDSSTESSDDEQSQNEEQSTEQKDTQPTE